MPTTDIHSPTALLASLLLIITLSGISSGISVPTGKETLITPARVTPRPTYHPPSAPAPVHEYTFDNPEPAPLDPSWIPVPVKYLNVLRANSVYYIPFRIPNPAAQQHNYYPVALKEVSQYTPAPTQTTKYQQPTSQQPTVYQSQQPLAVQQSQQPPVYQTQQPSTYQTTQQQPIVQQGQQSTTYQSQPPTAYQTQQPAVQQTQQPTTYLTQQSAVSTSSPTQAAPAQNALIKAQEFGAKLSPKQKIKPQYYLPKSQYGKQASKSGYPKKAVAVPSQKYYYYYPANAQ